MESWDLNKQQRIKTPNNIIKFIDEIESLCKKYDLSISHEDGHGAFIITKYDAYNIKWLKDCLIDFR